MTDEAVTNARAQFRAARDCIYMNVSVRGLLPEATRAAVERYLDRHADGSWDKAEMFAAVESAREKFARLIHAHPGEVAITKNASEGLNIMAASLDWRPGDNVVYCPDLEHPNNVYPWLNAETRWGAAIRSVPADDGRVPVDAIVDAIDERTRVVTVPTVSFSPGFVTDVGVLGAACRERGVLLVVDAAQSVGVIHTDVERLGVDALAAATQKGLLSFYGFGFLYCRQPVAESLRPAYLARYGVAVGRDAHETAMHRESLTLADGARRFDLGNYNYLGATAAGASLGLLLDVGTERIERHVRHLARRLAEGFLGLGLPVVGGPPGADLGHIVTVGDIGAGGHDSADDPAMNALYRHLLANDVRLSIRRGVLRFSLHLYNTEDDVDEVVELARRWVGEDGIGGPRPA